MQNRYKDKFYKLNKLYDDMKDTKKRLDSAVDLILLGNKQKEIVEKVSKEEQEQIVEHFGINLKHPLNFTRTIDKSQIEHTLKQHGDSIKEEQRGNIAVSLDDIKNYLDIVHNAHMKRYEYNHLKQPVVVSGKQVNGHFVVVEEIRTGKSDLAFFTMRKTKGQLQEGTLILAKDKLPALRSKSLLSYSESITNSTIKSQEEKALESITKSYQTNVDSISKEESKKELSNNIDFESLNKFAEPLEKSDSIIKLVNDFKNPIKTPIGEFKINMDYMLNKAIQRDGGARLDMIGYIKPTLQRPAYIIEVDNKLHFIKPFFDEKSKVKKFLSVIPNRDKDINLITSFILQDKDIQRVANNGKIIKDFTKLEGRPTELAPVLPRADLNSPKASNSIGKPIRENIANQSLKETKEKALEDISFEELDKKGLIPFANGHTLGAGFFGGSEALYNQRDYNNDGKTDIEDIVIGALGGIIGFKALAKMFPKWFAETNVSNSINSNKLNKEKKNISKVAFGEKPSTIIRTYDKDSLDRFITDNTKLKHNIEFEKGGFNEYTKKGVGFEKIAIRHMQDGSDGYISLDELTKIGEVIRDGEFKLKSNGLREYTYFDNNIRYKAIVGDKSNNQRVVSFYSNRRGKGHDARILFGNPPKDGTGLEHNAQHYTFSTDFSDGIIITYKPKTTFKEWINNFQKENKEISKQTNTNMKRSDGIPSRTDKKTRRYKNR